MNAVSRWLAAALIAGMTALLAFSPPLAAQEDGPTPEEYIANATGEAALVPFGEFQMDGRRMDCGKRPTVLDHQLDDYGAAYPGFLIFNPKLLEKLTPAVKKWIFSHECGHQFRGPDEATADCFAVQRGRRYGWLDEKGLEEVCQFMSPAKGDNMHFSGPQRCEYMKKCFADPTVR